MELDKERQLAETENLAQGSGYEQIYPVVHDTRGQNRKYQKLIKISHDLQNEFSQGKVKVIYH